MVSSTGLSCLGVRGEPVHIVSARNHHLWGGGKVNLFCVERVFQTLPSALGLGGAPPQHHPNKDTWAPRSRSPGARQGLTDFVCAR
eukprot:6353043-Amphidinium_carterae.1